jgi:uncharacterized membrane protein
MRLFSIRPGLSMSGRKFKGLRGWAGKPAHPPLTDFPIVCYVLTAAFDVVSFVAEDGSDVARDFYRAGTYVWWPASSSRSARRSRACGTGGRGWSAGRTPGRSAARSTQVWRTANWHIAVMLTVTAIVVVDVMPDLGLRGSVSAFVAVLSILAALLVAFGAAYGGTMVFDYQFNVESLKNSTVWDETEVDQLYRDKKVPPPSS